MKGAVCTIIAKNYLAHARVLMSSVRRWNPDLLRIVILADTADGCFEPQEEDFTVIPSTELPIPSSKWFHFKYNILELNTGIKPYALELLLDRYGLDRLIYLDPDIKLYRPLDLILDSLETSDVVLTPHLTEPIDDAMRPSELDILRAGAYNLGFIAIANSQNTRSFLGWWQKNVFDQCRVDVERGLFVDQRWIDLVPGLFEKVCILREPGLNVAYWNIHSRRIQKQGEIFRVNGDPLCFFHFSGFVAERIEQFSKYQDRFRTSELGDAALLVRSYREDLLEHGYETCKDWPYRYASFSDGTPIPDVTRVVHQENPALLEWVEDPFSDEGLEAFVETWNDAIQGPGGGVLTRLAHRIYLLRPDVRAVMPDVFGAHRLQYLHWLLESGRRDYGLPEALLAPVREALNAELQPESVGSAESVSGGSSNGLVPSVSGPPAVTDNAAGITAEESGREDSGRLRLTSLAKLIYDSRPDLQSAFADPCGRDSLRYLTWLFTYGRREYNLDSLGLEPLRSEWKRLLSARATFLHSCWCRARLAAYSAAARFSKGPQAVPGVALSPTGATPSDDGETQRMNSREPMELHRGTRVRAVDEETKVQDGSRFFAPAGRRRAAPAAGKPLGINAVGYVNAEMGVGEVVRTTIRAAEAADLATAVKKVSTAGIYRERDKRFQEDSEHNYPFNVIHVNADQVPSTLPALGNGFFQNKYNIGYWCWEVEEFPDHFCPSFQHFEEIWTLSSFSQDSISRKSPVPVLRISPAIEIGDPPARSRSYFGLPEDPFLFVTAFDILSVFDRKNPLGVIRSFIEAFQGEESSHLVVKVANGYRNPEAMRNLRLACGEAPVTIIDKMMKREDVYALFDVCDCLVSLHRSEGFGLTIAESMYLGKPVVVTGYSGNMDFTRIGNSFLVGYELVQVPSGCGPYPQTARWAEPSMADAVAQLRLVRGSPEKRRQVASAGQADVKKLLSPKAVGRLIRQRLETLSGATANRSAAAGRSAISMSEST